MNRLQISSIKPHLTFRINSIYFLYAWILCIVFVCSIYHLCILWNILIQQPCYCCLCYHPSDKVCPFNFNSTLSPFSHSVLHEFFYMLLLKISVWHMFLSWHYTINDFSQGGHCDLSTPRKWCSQKPTAEVNITSKGLINQCPSKWKVINCFIKWHILSVILGWKLWIVALS